MTDFVEYKRPFIVLLIFSLIILIIVNYGSDMFKYENFVDAPYLCNEDINDRKSCIEYGGYWKEDGNLPAGCNTACTCCIPNTSFPISAQYSTMTCAPSTDSYTLTNITTKYSNSLLPTTAFQRSADGIPTEAAIKQHIDNLINQTKILAPPELSADSQTIYAYLQKDESVINEIQTEYCYYSTRYTYAITQLLRVASIVETGSSVSQGADWLTSARTLNTRLIDLISIMKYLTTQRLSYGVDPSTTQLNANLAVRIKSLSEQNNDLVGPNANTTLYKKMVQYTKEKGKANGNLVLLYTFMNLIALGMLFYVYSAT